MTREAHTDEALVGEESMIGEAFGEWCKGAPTNFEARQRAGFFAGYRSALASRLATITPDREAVARLICELTETSFGADSVMRYSSWVTNAYPAADAIIALFNTGKAETP